MSMRLFTPDRRGDTIVEVIVVLAVLGMAVSISYATANTSLLDARQAQENSQAAELVATQVEDIRLLAAKAVTGPNDVFSYGASTPFCVINDNTNSNANSVAAAPKTPTGGCNYYNLYDVSIIGPGSSGGTFTVTVTWDDVQGQGKDTVTLLYRLYPNS